MDINSFAIYTLGCKVNIFESNSMRNQLLMNGLIEKSFNEFADIYIINTCSVTSKADAKSINIIKRSKKNNPNAITIVSGCFSQMNKDIHEKYNIDILIGNKHKNNIYDLISEYFKKKERIVRIENLFIENKFEENEDINFTTQTRAFVKIQDGCNFMCSYCIIPFSRGMQRSKKMVNILDNINYLKKEFKEIVITGVNTAGYNDGDNNFESLLFSINKIEGDFRIRISSIEPFQVTEGIINLITENKERFCQQWHICLQSGSNDVLKSMNRKYSVDEFYKLINKIRNKSPMTTFTTDYIVGFPTETESDHIDSIELLTKIRFLDMHIFPYSKRKGTASYRIKDIDSSILKRRIQEITLINKSIRKSIMEEFIGKKLNVIFEKSNSQIFQIGFSSEYIKVMVKSKSDFSKQKKKVLIIKNSIDGLVGKIIY